MKLSKDSRKLSRTLFKGSFSKGRLDHAKITSIVRMVSSQKPRDYLGVLKSYQRLLRLETEKHHAIIESVASLPAEITSRVTRDLKSKYGEDLTTEFKINPELIGGLRIRIGSDVWDGSVRNRLQRLERELVAA